jgi:hypothetical protein
MKKMEKRGREEDVLAMRLSREGRRKNRAACIEKKKILILFINLNIKCSSDLLKLANFDDFLCSI